MSSLQPPEAGWEVYGAGSREGGQEGRPGGLPAAADQPPLIAVAQAGRHALCLTACSACTAVPLCTAAVPLCTAVYCRRYVDYPITDVLQMMGRAGRPQYDKHGVAVIMVGVHGSCAAGAPCSPAALPVSRSTSTSLHAWVTPSGPFTRGPAPQPTCPTNLPPFLPPAPSGLTHTTPAGPRAQEELLQEVPVRALPSGVLPARPPGRPLQRRGGGG